MIITDQDPVLREAISQALTNTFRRYCSWYILDKFSEKLDAVAFKGYYKDFQNIYGNLAPRRILIQHGWRLLAKVC